MRIRSIAPVLLALAALTGSARGQNYVFGANVRVNDDSPGENGHNIYSPGGHLIAARGESVYVTWADDRSEDYFHAFFARSIDGGQTFEPNLQIDSTLTVPIAPSLALDANGVIHICWNGLNEIDGRIEVSYVKSTDGGRHFSLPCAASESSFYIGPASIATSRSGQRVYVARRQGGYPIYDIIVSGSTDGGETFSLPETKVNSDTASENDDPSVAVFDDTIVLVAWDNGVGAFLARSIDGGASFSPEILLDDTTGGHSGSDNPSVGVDASGRVYVLSANPESALMLSISDDTGRSFHHEQALPAPGGDYPCLCVSPDGRLYLTWTLNGYPSEVRFAYSPDGGQTFLPYVNPSNTRLGSQGPGTVTANDAGRVFAAWEDTRNDPAGFADDIYCAGGGMTGIEESGRGDAEVGMCRVWPNPARSSVNIEYALRQTGSAGVSIYDLTGSLVERWTRSNAGTGNHITTWNGTNASGQRVGSGVYFIRIETAEGSMSKKLQLLGD